MYIQPSLAISPDTFCILCHSGAATIYSINMSLWATKSRHFLTSEIFFPNCQPRMKENIKPINF